MLLLRGWMMGCILRCECELAELVCLADLLVERAYDSYRGHRWEEIYGQ